MTTTLSNEFEIGVINTIRVRSDTFHSIGILRNNLFIAGRFIWLARDTASEFERPPQWDPDWNTDVDFDGFDYGGETPAFRWYDDSAGAIPTQDFANVAELVAALGIEQNGVEVDRNEIFEEYTVSRAVSLTLAPGGAAVDAGQEVPNLADFYGGTAPDLGAHESGTTVPIGPRGGAELHERDNYWDKH